MKHKRQHYIPVCYLDAWTDPSTPSDHHPYVWLFSNDGSNLRKRAPKNSFVETDMYTVHAEDGSRDLRIETNLARLEGQFSHLRRDKLEPRQTLDVSERLILMMFLAAMYARTKSYEDHWRRQWEQVLELGNKMQDWAENATPEERQRMASISRGHAGDDSASYTMDDIEEFTSRPIQASIDSIVTGLPRLLLQLPSVVITTSPPNRFITSDAPCVWFDRANYEKPRKPGAGGLVSPSLEITLPISPSMLLYMGRGLIIDGLYMEVDDPGLVDNFNLRTAMWAYEDCVTNTGDVNASWIPEKPT